MEANILIFLRNVELNFNVLDITNYLSFLNFNSLMGAYTYVWVVFITHYTCCTHIYTHLEIELKSWLEVTIFKLVIVTSSHNCSAIPTCLTKSVCNKMSNVGFISFTFVSDQIESLFIFAGCFEGYQYKCIRWNTSLGLWVL